MLGLVVAALGCGCGNREERKLEYFNRAQDHFSAKNYAKARIDVRNALQIDEDYVEARYLYAEIYEIEKDWPQVVANLRAVLDADENHINARVKFRLHDVGGERV